ncbi:TraB/GumN family protein [Thermomonas brevis]|uniref:TraB/GumN family protein n=1 Tax=Thermomonas brevis TaxID=215691 RepID=A0A7G9QV68_9GAMM|nr:TraB/GumN family protein [Thermomonas brevis]QNN47243.1 TraB/GumN family protein [Thermomonas brevis]
MKPRLLALALCALLIPAAHADQPAQDGKRPLLWKVSDADNSVYLLGSFHLLKADDYPLPAEVDRAFDDSASLLFEVDPAAMTAPESVAAMQKYMAYEDGKTLSAVLPKPTLAKLGTLVSASGGSLQALEHSEPWAVNLGLVLGITQAMGFRPELGLDRKLMERAQDAGKPAAGLETVEDQMKAMDAVPYAEQAQGLEEFLDDPQKSIREMGDMHAWWRAGDVAKLDAEMRAEMARKTPESYRLLDVERNQAWLPQVEKRLSDSKKDNTLVVVGALHLLGGDGLVEQLRAKGYTVERMCDACAAD